MKKIFTLSALIAASFIFSQTIFINELHYDNSSTDSGEGVEIAGPAGTDLTGYQVVPYNGNGGTQYSVQTLSGTITDQENGYGTVWVNISGLQNGAPDGVALVDASGTVLQFLSYEGSFTATDGPASGETSVDIGVSEGSEAAGTSLQLQGTGTEYTDFTWTSTAITATPDAVNTSQTFSSTLAVSDVNIKKNNFIKANVVDDTLVFLVDSKVQILNMNGQVVKSTDVKANTNLNVSLLSKGIYIVTGQVNGKVVSQKIIKR